MATLPKHYVTVEEYLALEEQSEERHEYFDGEMFVIEAASRAHAQLSSTLLGEFYIQLKGSSCQVRGTDMRLRTSAQGLYSYADVLVFCSAGEFDADTLLNPVVILEVLSGSTSNYDRGEKFRRYRQIPSFREYILFAQNEVYLEHHVREESGAEITWRMRELRSREDVLTLQSVPVLLPVSTIYSGLDV